MKTRRITRSLLCVIGFVLLFSLSGCIFFDRTIPEGDIPGRTPEDHFVTIDNIRYHYREYPGPGPEVLLLHGFASSTATWEKVVPHLAARGYHVWVLDMKGFGWSDKPEDAKYDALTLMEEVSRWMDVMGIKKAVLAGNSLGGGIAVLMALMHPEKTDRLILIDSAGYPNKKPLVMRMAAIPFAAEITRLFFGRWMVRSVLKDVCDDKRKITDAQVDAYFVRLTTPRAIFAQTALVRLLNTDMLDPYIRRIPEIRNRTLILWGENDRWIPLASGYRFNKDIAESKLIVFPDCGHIPQEEKPEETAEAMIVFIEEKL